MAAFSQVRRRDMDHLSPGMRNRTERLVGRAKRERTVELAFFDVVVVVVVAADNEEKKKNSTSSTSTSPTKPPLALIMLLPPSLSPRLLYLPL